ncbi:MAG: hypothetical protein EPN91_08560 [Salinibacterium sp.]|nr:MAG: hypothetical protein EPN91_08560 [Salinibacterium sp.]
MPPNQNPYCPAPGEPAPPAGRIASFLQEALDLSPAIVRGVGVTMSAALTTATTTGSSKYKVPADQELVVFALSGFLKFAALSSEPTAILGWLNLDPSERWFVKSQNCNVGLKNTDRSLDVFDGDGVVPMSAITPPVGTPMYWHPEAPNIFNAGHTLQATFTLGDTTAAVVGTAGNSTTYGLLLTGNLIPNRNR